jgi:hypothetical protein
MPLTVAKIQSAKDDDELFQLLSGALNERFSSEVKGSTDEFLTALAAAPRGLRAMAAIFELDVSMTLDDLAWHFLNHNDERIAEETLLGLKELGATETADIFGSAWEIVKPSLPKIRATDWEDEDPHEFFETGGIQSRIDPLNDRLWAICKTCGDNGLLQYWLEYARKHPERCVEA